MNPLKLTILTADTDAACDRETGICTIPQTPIPSPGAVLRPESSPPAPAASRTPPRPALRRVLRAVEP